MAVTPVHSLFFKQNPANFASFRGNNNCLTAKYKSALKSRGSLIFDELHSVSLSGVLLF